MKISRLFGDLGQPPVVVRIIDPLLGVGIFISAVLGLERSFRAAIRASAWGGESGS